MQSLSFHSQRQQDIGIQAIHQDHWSLHVHLRQRHLFHNLRLLQKRYTSAKPEDD